MCGTVLSKVVTQSFLCQCHQPNKLCSFTSSIFNLENMLQNEKRDILFLLSLKDDEPFLPVYFGVNYRDLEQCEDYYLELSVDLAELIISNESEESLKADMENYIERINITKELLVANQLAGAQKIDEAICILEDCPKPKNDTFSIQYDFNNIFMAIIETMKILVFVLKNLETQKMDLNNLPALRI